MFQKRKKKGVDIYICETHIKEKHWMSDKNIIYHMKTNSITK